MMPTGLQGKISEAIGIAKNQYYKLVVFVENDEKNRTKFISDLAGSYGVDVINLNLHLCARLLEKSARERVSLLLEEFRNILDIDAPLIILNHCEVLFDNALKNDPLKLLENISRNKTLLVAWPGSYRGGNLIYATPGHPEYRNYENPEILIVTGHDTSEDYTTTEGNLHP
jgi:hypothetical protein